MTVGLVHFLVIAVLLFGLGFYTVLTRKSAIGILMGVEVIINAANLNFVAFSRYGALTNPLAGQVIPVFGIMIAAAEAAVGLAIVLAIYQNWKSIDTSATTSLRE
ncbi:MAG: NADH-quinone oxidoreductase subunit NuoK [Deltaproteobacteria bacterium]|nr:NADH-quinone oxidoreductase subunit NuoK [Deltaproteobacteria bacterium]